jgi:hypothetical protein
MNIERESKWVLMNWCPTFSGAGYTILQPSYNVLENQIDSSSPFTILTSNYSLRFSFFLSFSARLSVSLLAASFLPLAYTKNGWLALRARAYGFDELMKSFIHIRHLSLNTQAPHNTKVLHNTGLAFVVCENCDVPCI